MARILIVEDEPDMLAGLRFNLESDGYQVDVAQDGGQGLEKALRNDADLIVLDVMLPGLGGLELLERLRSAGVSTPVVMLTARGLETDKMRGLRMGADDYVTKPFSIGELGARIEAVLRRAGEDQGRVERAGGTRLTFGGLEIDVASRTVNQDGRTVALSYKEFELLRILVERAGETVSRQELLHRVWGYDENRLPTTRTVDTHVANLRKKLESGGRRHIHTVHKVGYRFLIEPE